MASRSLTDRSLLLLVAALFSALVLPALFMDGMFNDGVFYAAISRNLAEGHGTIWNMYFSDTYYPEMHEQPPLMFVLQAGFFKIFGNGIYTERIYCTVTAIISSILVIRSWNLITRATNETSIATADRLTAYCQTARLPTGWLPLFLWIIMPVTFYAFTNNLEECTMVIFVLLAFNSILRAILYPNEKKYLWIIAGAWILAAGLTKGVQGMFLLSAPFWCWLILKNGTAKDFIARTFLISLVPGLFVLIAWFTPFIHDSFAAYFGSRFGKTFSGITAHGDTRVHILFELLIDTLPTMAFMLLFIIAGSKTTGFAQKVKSNGRMIAFVFACAFSGILPLLVTREQRGFYLVTALPLIAIACGLLILPAAHRFSAFIAGKKQFANAFTLVAIAGIGIVIFLTVQNAGEPKREAEKIAGLHEIATITGDGVTFNATSWLNNDWGFMSYGQRYHHFSFTDQPALQLKWHIAEKGATPPVGYTAIMLKSTAYDLYRKTDE